VSNDPIGFVDPLGLKPLEDPSLNGCADLWVEWRSDRRACVDIGWLLSTPLDLAGLGDFVLRDANGMTGICIGAGVTLGGIDLGLISVSLFDVLSYLGIDLDSAAGGNGCLFDSGRKLGLTGYFGSGPGIGASVGASAGITRTNARTPLDFTGPFTCKGGGGGLGLKAGPIATGEFCIGEDGIWSMSIGIGVGAGTPEVHEYEGSTSLLLTVDHNDLGSTVTVKEVAFEVFKKPFNAIWCVLPWTC